MGPRHLLVDGLGEVTAGDVTEVFAQIGVGFGAVHLACADQTGEARRW